MRILVIGDTHTGSTVAPWPKEAPLPDGGLWDLNPLQRWLGYCWDQMLEELLDLEIDVIVHGGDEIEGANDRNGQIITNRTDYQVGAAIDLLSPLRELAPRFYLLRGTGWHVGKGAQDSTAVARALEATPNPKTGELTWPDLFLDVGGPVIHFAHHIGSVSNPMYESGALLRSLLTLRSELDETYGINAPDVRGIVRFHRHRMLSVQRNNWWAATVTGWQFKTDFGYKIATDKLPQIGYLLIEYDTELRFIQRRFEIPRLHIETN